MYISLNDLKEHLYIDETDTTQDKYLMRLISTVEEAVRLHLDVDTLDDVCTEDGLPSNIQQAILLLCGTYYDNRNSEVIGATPIQLGHGYDYLLGLTKNYSC